MPMFSQISTKILSYPLKFQALLEKVGWLVVFGLNGPLRQYFSLYRAVSQREGERGEKRIDESKNVQTTPHPHLLQAQQALALL